MLIKILVILFIVNPLGEWIIHYSLHKINNIFHDHHHEIISKNNFKNYISINSIEIWPLIIIIPCIYYKYYLIMIGFIKYWVIHNITHYTDNYLIYLKNHHILYYKYKKYNFAVSAIWPDKLMNTIKYN